MSFVIPTSQKFQVVGSHRKAASYCEGCRKVKPRTGKVQKGWRCEECRSVPVAKVSDSGVDFRP